METTRSGVLQGPTQLTNEIEDKICKLIANGNYPESAAIAAGIKPAAYLQWLARGRKEISEGYDNAQYAHFVYAVKKAEASAQDDAVSHIKKAWHGGALIARLVTTRKDGSTNVTETFQAPQWQAAGWYLERRYPELYGKKERVDSSVRKEAERIAAEIGIPVEELLEEAKKIRSIRQRT